MKRLQTTTRHPLYPSRLSKPKRETQTWFVFLPFLDMMALVRVLGHTFLDAPSRQGFPYHTHTHTRYTSTTHPIMTRKHTHLNKPEKFVTHNFQRSRTRAALVISKLQLCCFTFPPPSTSIVCLIAAARCTFGAKRRKENLKQ